MRTTSLVLLSWFVILIGGCGGGAGDADNPDDDECAVGSRDCACTSGGACDPGLACSGDDLCEPDGGCACDTSGSCDDGCGCDLDCTGSETRCVAGTSND